MALAVLTAGSPWGLSEPSPGDMESREESPSPDTESNAEETELETERDSMESLFDGVLRDDMVSEGLSKLTCSSVAPDEVFLNLTLSNRMLRDIQILCGYVHLMKLDLSFNEISDLSCVSHMPRLEELNASNNKLLTFFHFTAPTNLKVVDLSYNQITNMKDLSAYKTLTKLVLNHNNIQVICGLEKCSSLSYLDLSHNNIATICDFGSLPLKTLCLSSNQIKNITGLENVKTLQILDLSNNQISSLEGLEGLDFLLNLNLEDNEISQISEIAYIEELPLLHVLNLLKNPVQEQADYCLSVVFMLQRLTELDLKKVKIEEKVAAVNKYDPPPEVIAARDHMAHVMYGMIQPQKIYDSTLPTLDTPYPMLVLTGPQSSGKRELAHRMCREFKEFFRYGPCHTTRNPYFGEEKRFDYHFVTPQMFEEMTCSGQFVVTMKYSGHYYGLSREAIESVAREGLACCTHMEIEGVRSLKNSCFEPRYILLLPINKEKYEGWLRRKGLFTRPEIEVAVNRVDMYMKIHQNNPGFFDAVINTDDLDEAYKKLSLLIKEYLGLTEPGQSSQSIIRDKSGSDTGKSLSGSSHSVESKLPRAGTTELLDAAATNYSARVSAKMSSQKTPLEEASVQRRQQAARQALAAKSPGTYTQLFQRSPLTAPATLGTHRRLLDPTSCSSMLPSGSNITADRSLPLASPDSSSKDSRASSGLSLLSSAGAFSARRSSSSSQQTPVINIHSPPEDKIQPLDLSGIGQSPDTADQQGAGSTPETPRLSSTESADLRASKSTSSTSSRASTHLKRQDHNLKPVLPPIPLGHNKPVR